MDNLEFLRNSPAQELLKQLETPLAIARKTALHYDGVFRSGAVLTAMKVANQYPINELSSVFAYVRNELQTLARQQTPVEQVSVALNKNVASLAASEIVGRATGLAARPFVDSPTQSVAEAMQKDWGPIIESMNLAQEKCAMEANNLAILTESWRQGLARGSATLAAVCNTVEAGRVLDPMNVFSTLDIVSMPGIRQSRAWATPIFLEQLEVPVLPKIRAANIVACRSFRNYQMAEAFDLMSDFERDLREFIHDAMLKVFGVGWEKSRLPSGMYEEWVEKRKKARAAGESSERLIDYADFTEYVSIIGQKNNWNEVFQSRFRRLQFVQESLYRLQPIRVCTMHSRILPREMWQVLRTETMLLSDKMWN
jgi:hypothetical protein